MGLQRVGMALQESAYMESAEVRADKWRLMLEAAHDCGWPRHELAQQHVLHAQQTTDKLPRHNSKIDTLPWRT